MWRRRFLLFAGGPVGSAGGVGGHQSRRFAPDRDGGGGGEHAVGDSASAKALALGAAGGSVRAGGGVACIFFSVAEAGARADLRILSGVRAGNRGRVRRRGRAERGGQFVPEEVSRGGGLVTGVSSAWRPSLMPVVSGS